ncbi:MAG: restriction endonuclease subunit M [Methylocystis sp.]|nr:MAG: restriction endonuclease subunit M [Methylocystis sp.]
MTELFSSFISKAFLRSVWALEFEAFKGSEEEAALDDRLRRWSERKDLRETSAEAAFIHEFFHDTWGHTQTGQAGAEGGSFTLWPKFPIAGAGERGGVGTADLAIGFFQKDEQNPIPQIVCEFKDIRSDLDAPQKRKGNNRSPVRQCLDYLSYARRGLFPTDPILPTWGIVTDMNEFRLYWFDKGHHQSVRFTIRAEELFKGGSLISAGEASRFDRFLFRKILHRDTLISPTGRSLLVSLIGQQRFNDRQLENTFYAEYRKFRERLYLTLLQHNGEGTPRFPGTRGRLVRLAQKILDRCIFIFFCEDMGQVLAFPPKLLQEFLIDRSNDPYFDADGTTIWQDMLRLFKAMNEGRAFGGKALNQFNGGLFAQDDALEKLHVPNSVFCQHMQGANEGSLCSFRETLLYLCASYNYATDLGRADGARSFDRDPSKSLGLYTLGRIFEQSITELEILEAEADNRPSINKESKRKRDGVYYTPEWVVERIVDETLGPRLAEIKKECGWPAKGDPSLEVIDACSARLKSLTVIDPACGSGAFLITVLRYLVEAWHEVQGLRRQITKGRAEKDSDDELIADILKSNIYGVDINPASVEIARLALWLHTARGDKPLSSLDENIREGNSLIGSEFYKGQIDLALYDDVQKERVNAFDWETAFPEVFARGGFDAVVGNPPYVKLQNFRTVHADMALYLRDGRAGVGTKPYASTQTGNFDLYLPFIEKGIRLLNDKGRLGYIAPSLWTANEYGEGLRSLISKGRNLDRWIDFKAFQIFEESITYTALQFFTKMANESIRVADAPAGDIPPEPWADGGLALPYGREVFGGRWLLLTGQERALMDRLYEHCKRLDDPTISSDIFQGVKTGADQVYKLKKIAGGRYLCMPDESAPYEVALEDALLFPILSGPESKRYNKPDTQTYLLFPYERSDGVAKLIPSTRMQSTFPRCWKYLESWKELLIQRDNGELNDDAWYRFSRSQSLNRVGAPKLVAAGTVPSLRFSYDEDGGFFLTGGRVDGVVPVGGMDPWFLLGILNAPVADFVFRRIGRVKAGGFFEANKQFIAPLPIPPASDEERAIVATKAKALQRDHTARRDTLEKISRRLSAARTRNKPETWLFPELKSKRDLIADAPVRLDAGKKREWAEQRYNLDLTTRHDAISARLIPGSSLSASFKDGELSILIDGVPVIDRIFVDNAEGEFVLAQWKLLAATFAITEKTDGKKLANALRKLVVADNPALVQQIITLEGELSELETKIEREEAEINALLNGLYGLTEAEARLIENG